MCAKYVECLAKTDIKKRIPLASSPGIIRKVRKRRMSRFQEVYYPVDLW